MFGEEAVADLFGGRGTLPDQLEDGLLQLGQGPRGLVTGCHVTYRSTYYQALRWVRFFITSVQLNTISAANTASQLHFPCLIIGNSVIVV